MKEIGITMKKVKMMSVNPTAFVSYSWDSNEHKEWVLHLIKQMLENGIDTTIDKFETQTETINLYNMMLKNINKRDYIILVLTENYAHKADDMQGGVGFETNVITPYIMKNLNKLIPIVRTVGDKSKAIPFYLRGVHYIDFSQDNKFDESFKELLHRIYKVEMIEKPTLGRKPDLQPTRIADITTYNCENEYQDLIPDFKQVTDIEKNRFIKQSFTEINGYIKNLLEKTKSTNSTFEYEFETISTKKTIIRLYLNGHLRQSEKIWVGNMMGSRYETINVSYGDFIDDSDSSMNEIIQAEVDEHKNLCLRMTMDYSGNLNANDSKSIAMKIWKNVIENIM